MPMDMRERRRSRRVAKRRGMLFRKRGAPLVVTETSEGAVGGDLRERRREIRASRRRARLGGFLPEATAPDIDFTFGVKADLSGQDLESGGGKLVPEQGDLRRRKRRRKDSLGLLFRRQVQETPHETGPVPTATPRVDQLVIPAELRGQRAVSDRDKNALKALFGADLARLPDEFTDFAMRELSKASVGDKLAPEVIQEVFRVCNTASVLCKVEKADGTTAEQPLQIKKADDDLRVVWGEVYIPGLPDSQGDFMTAEEIRKAAWGFMAQGLTHAIDQMHDGVECGAFVVDSFFNDPDVLGANQFIEKAWVIGVHIPDDAIWKKVKDGTFNGFSMEGVGTRAKKQFELELPDEIRGRTSVDNAHDHEYVVRIGDDGVFQGGEALPAADPTADGAVQHGHKIQKASVTEREGKNPHVHRFSVSEAILEVAIGRRPPETDEIDQTGHAT